MIINYFNLIKTVFIVYSKAHSKLVIYTNAILPFPVSVQEF